MDAPSDDILIQRIAVARDQNALAELYRRHENAAFSLARYLTRDAARAEEALQDAMLTVWNEAARYRPHNPRGWLLSIVAQKSFRQKRGQSRREVAIEVATQSVRSTPQEESLDHLVHGETLDALRTLLRRLPEQDRHLVGLYYAGGLSQDEIAEVLHMPQRTVSNRLREVLDMLRTRLAAQGLATAAPVCGGALSEGLLRDSILSATRAPQGLAESLLGKTFSGTQQSARAAVVAGSAQWIWLAVSLVLAAAGAGAWLWLKPGASPAVRHQANPDTLREETVSSDVFHGEPTPVHRTWDFATGTLKELKPIAGAWDWNDHAPFENANKQTEGAMVAPKEQVTLLPLPSAGALLPLRVAVHIHSTAGGKWWRSDAFWTGPKSSAWSVPPCDWFRSQTQAHEESRPMLVEIFFLRNFSVQVFDRKTVKMVRRFNLPEREYAVCLALENVAVQKIDLDTVSEAELPSFVQDPDRVIQSDSLPNRGSTTSQPVLDIYKAYGSVNNPGYR